MNFAYDIAVLRALEGIRTPFLDAFFHFRFADFLVIACFGQKLLPVISVQSHGRLLLRPYPCLLTDFPRNITRCIADYTSGRIRD